MIWLTLMGCRGVEPAPEDFDTLIHFFWQNADGDDAALQDAIQTLHDTEGDGLEEVVDGNVSRLTAEEAALVPSVDGDPANAAGIFMLNRFDCDLDTLRELLIAQDQMALREDTYIAYEREYRSSVDDYTSGVAPTLTWDVSLSAEIVFSEYSSELSGGIRDVPTEDLGTGLVTRTWFQEPASFDGNNSWTQDYQLEVYYEGAPGEIVHLYAMWRELEVAGFSSENSGVQRQVLNGLADWDDETAALCAGG